MTDGRSPTELNWVSYSSCVMANNGGPIRASTCPGDIPSRSARSPSQVTVAGTFDSQPISTPAAATIKTPAHTHPDNLASRTRAPGFDYPNRERASSAGGRAV
jgi:hypothetical protein